MSWFNRRLRQKVGGDIDMITAAPASGDFAQFDGAKWAPVTAQEADLGIRQTYTPTYGASGGTWGASTTVAEYTRVGSFISGFVTASGTTASNPTYLTVTLPSNPASDGSSLPFSAMASGGVVAGSAVVRNFTTSGGILRVYPSTDGTGTFMNTTVTIWVTFSYVE
jgi:hypothetical protein